MANREINPNLRKLAEKTHNPNLKTPDLDEILADKNSSVLDITEICKGFEEFMNKGMQEKSCIIPTIITNNYSPTKKQILEFSKRLSKYDKFGDSLIYYTTNYLTALMHSSKDNEFVIDLTALNEKGLLLNDIGYKLDNKKLEVIGNVGLGVGKGAQLSEIYIKGKMGGVSPFDDKERKVYQWKNGDWNEVKENE